MQPGFSITLETDCDQKLIHDKISRWGGKWLVFEELEDGERYTVVTDNPKNGVSQKTVIYCKNVDSDSLVSAIDSGKIIQFESALQTIDDDDPDNPSIGIPAFTNLRPSSLFSDLLSDGKWYRNGLNISNKAKRIGFDDVEEAWNTIEDSSERLPQVVIGWGGEGDLPSVDPDILSTILCGFADVYVPVTGAAMDSLNMRMGRFGLPSGSVRVFTSNPSVVSRQPLYTDERIRTRPNGRQFELDIFLRLAKITLTKNSMIHISESNESALIEEVSTEIEPSVVPFEEFERLKKLNQEILKMNNMLQQNNETLKSNIEDAFSEVSTLNDEILQLNLLIESYKEKTRSDKSVIKELNRALSEFKEIRPHMHKIISEEGLSNVDDFFAFIDNLREDDLDEGVEENLEFESINSVLQKIQSEYSSSFIILKSAFKSAKEHKKFRYSRRIMEAFEMMERSMATLRSTAGKNQKLNYEQIFRKNGDFSVANRETGTTMDQFGDHRKFRNGDKLITMGAHIKIGTGTDDECARIHFKFDKNTGKILIGHCGLHLPTASNR